MNTYSINETKTQKRKKVRIQDILAAKGTRLLTSLTCYDASFAKIFEQTDLDLILVGDSLGHTMQGKSTTITVTLDELAYHTSCVAKALHTPFLITDMPFATPCHVPQNVMQSAAQLIRCGAEAVKIEGASEQICENIQFLTSHGIPVMGHIGLIPQSIHTLSGYKIQGKTIQDQERLVNEALKLQAAGCFAIVLELVEPKTAAVVTNALHIPTIGIGSGELCDGQILVCHDMLGMTPDFRPKFLKHYLNLEQLIKKAVNEYCYEVTSRQFPAPPESL
ncbi:MAG: 3-methyl-2-oxobutanoate hydroxymethyltransferase [Silvanigrellaceae bacterium]|nr:3-methyl-2-oxobutanoate hydroxymethyltransferase [Silvanigrellaceae bacterium]